MADSPAAGGPTAADIAADLRAEQQALDTAVATLADDQWELATPSPRWAVRDQIGHLAFFDQSQGNSIMGIPQKSFCSINRIQYPITSFSI